MEVPSGTPVLTQRDLWIRFSGRSGGQRRGDVVRESTDSLAALAPLFFLCRLRGLFLFGASGSGAPLMEAFFSATLSRPPLERLLAWVLPTRGALISYHSRNIRSIFRGRYPCAGALPTKATSVSLSTATEALMSKRNRCRRGLTLRFGRLSSGWPR
jgi:hypothetical protein